MNQVWLRVSIRASLSHILLKASFFPVSVDGLRLWNFLKSLILSIVLSLVVKTPIVSRMCTVLMEVCTKLKFVYRTVTSDLHMED